MRGVSALRTAASAAIVRRELRDTEESFGPIMSEVARMLYPAPNTAAQIAAELKCSVRNIELCFQGKQNWSGDAIALFVAEICRRHAMRNLKVEAK